MPELDAVKHADLLVQLEHIPGDDGWWHGSGFDAFCTMAADLLAHGYTEKEALNLLEWAYAATSGEFGL